MIKFIASGYVLGLSVCLGVGPVFILTCRASIMFGFMRGVAVALGAACADALLFILGIKGLLVLIKTYKPALLAFDLIGGAVLIALGIYYWKHVPADTKVPRSGIGSSPLFLFFKSFALTILNPMTVFVFAFIGLKIFPAGVAELDWYSLIVMSLSLGAGTLSGICAISAIARMFRVMLSAHAMHRISQVTAGAFILIGGYFLVDLVIKTISFLK